MSREKIDRTVEAREHEESELYREDGTRLYGPEEHAEREADLKRRFRAAMDAIDEEVGGRITAAEESLLIAESSDPTDVLTTEELASANARRPFVSDEVFTLPLEKLEARCRAVLAQGDRPAMFLHSLYAGQRSGEKGSAAGEYMDTRYGEGGVITDEAGAERVREVAAELKKKLDPDGEKRRETARKALEEAREVKSYAYLRRRGARSAAELYMGKKYGGGAAADAAPTTLAAG